MAQDAVRLRKFALRCLLIGMIVWFAAASATLVHAQPQRAEPRSTALTAAIGDFERALETFRKADMHSQPELRSAWQAIAEGNREDVVAILATMEFVDNVTANWLSTAIDAIFDAERGEWNDDDLEKLTYFVADEQRGRLARKTAFDLLRRVAPVKAEQLAVELVDDPVAEFRRPGVQRLIEEAQKLTEQEADASTQLAAYRKALNHARGGDQVRTIASALAELEDPIVLADHFGFIRQWNIVGPFANVESEGFEREYAPESLADADSLLEVLDRGDAYEGKAGKVAWASFESDADTGDVDLNQAIAADTEVVGYGAAIVEMDRAQDVQLRLRLQNAFKIWVNGELLLAQPVGHTGNSFDQYQLETKLQKGKNLILVKSCQVKPLQEIDFFKVWHFGVRICDPTGGAVEFANRAIESN